MLKAISTARIEKLAADDHQHFVGKKFLVSVLMGYSGEKSVVVDLKIPVEVIIQNSPASQIMSWNDNWLDTNYNVELVKSHPELDGVRNLWMDGHSYHANGKQTEAAQFKQVSQ